MPPSADRRPELDGLRAVAIAGVLGVHANGLLPGGHLGVAVFFVLSGYLITTLLLREFGLTGTVSLRCFYLRRGARLFPALFTVLVLFGPVAVAIGKPPLNVGLGVGAAALYCSNLVMATLGSAVLEPFAWAWTLSFEEQFYALWPVALVAAARRGRLRTLAVWAVVLSVAAVVLRWVLPFAPGMPEVRIYAAPDTRMDGLLIGCLLGLLPAHLTVRPVVRWADPLAASAAAVLALGYGLAAYGHRATYTVWIAAAELATAVLILTVTACPGGRAARLLAVRPAAHIGRISYGLYLWNFPVARIEQYLFPGRLPSPFNGVLWLAGTFVLAEASHRLVEQPVLALVRPRLARAGGTGVAEKVAVPS